MPSTSSSEYEILAPFENPIHTCYVALSSRVPFVSSHLKDQELVLLATFTKLTDYIRPVLVSLFVISIPFLFNFVATWLFFQIQSWSKKAARIPPTIPHSIPFLGSSLDFGFNPLNFVKSSTKLCRNQMPFRVALPNINVYFVQGSENIVSLFRKSGTTTGTPVHLFCLKFFFGLPPDALRMYANDDSGFATLPVPGSVVAPHNRIDYRTHAGLLKLTSGVGLEGYYQRWATGYRDRLQSLDIRDEWVEMPDFLDFFSDTFGSALVESIGGPTLLRLNPKFARDLTKYDLHLPGLLKGLPRWLVPRAYQARDKLLSTIKQWHDYAREHFQASMIDQNGDTDPYWGSAFIRERQSPGGIFTTAENFDHNAQASSDLGFIWAANTSLLPAAMWSALEIFKDPTLLSRTRAELEQSCSPTVIQDAQYHSHILVSLPLLQSIYAETLRLRIRAYAPRYTDRSKLQINGWTFPRKSVILVSTETAHMDTNVWNTKDGERPIDVFWADRFLVYPDDPSSGPVKNKATKEESSSSSLEPNNDTGPKFSLAGTNGVWIPYGGGPRMCVGRAFSKRTIIAASAMMASWFDVEILADEKALRMDPKYYGLAGQQPMGKVPFKIRKRK